MQESNNVARTKGIPDDPILTRKLAAGGFVTYQDRLAVSKIFAANGYNLDKTARQLGVNEDQVKKWHEQVSCEAIGEVENEKREFAVEAQRVTAVAFDIKESEFINLAFNIKLAAIKRVQELIPEADSLRDLTAVVKVMHEINTGSRLSEEESNKLDNKSPSVMLQIAYNTLNNFNTTPDGKEKSTKRNPKRSSKGQTTKPGS